MYAFNPDQLSSLDRCFRDALIHLAKTGRALNFAQQERLASIIIRIGTSDFKKGCLVSAAVQTYEHYEAHSRIAPASMVVPSIQDSRPEVGPAE
ncbi:MAG: hypothetical protein JSS20_16565 [Proteobacteria bacterium]|nr:hypothetical protein [Pseudomonadota bacterium]